MKLVILITEHTKYTMDIATAWQQMGASGVTILEGYGLHRLKKEIGMQDDLPILASLATLLKAGRQVETHLLVSVVHDNVAKKLHHETTLMMNDLSPSLNVIILTLSIDDLSGL